MAFTQQQLEDAYRQMEQERQAEANLATAAATRLYKAINASHHVQAKDDGPWHSSNCISPYTRPYALVLELSSYDDWNLCIANLTAAGAAMKPWNGNVHSRPEGSFADGSVTYTVRIEWYDGGY